MEKDELKFFPSKKALKNFYKQRNFIFRILDFFFYLLRSNKFYFNLLCNLLIKKNNEIKSFGTLDYNKLQPKKKLVVALHGLNNTPLYFHDFFYEFKSYDQINEYDLLIPLILNKGNADLKQITSKILVEINKWAINLENSKEEKELVLVGFSNGARIAKSIETEIGLNNHLMNISKIKFISIAGAVNGSYLVNLIKRFGLNFFINPLVSEELSINCKKIKELDERWKNSFRNSSNIKRKYFFIAASFDYIVPNESSTLPDINHDNTHYALLLKDGHLSALSGSAKATAKLIIYD
jgi:hypothetical protein